MTLRIFMACTMIAMGSAGCAKKRILEAARHQLAQQDSVITELRQQHQGLQLQLSTLQQQTTNEREELQAEIQILRSQLEVQVQAAANFSQTLDRARAYIAQLRGQRPPPTAATTSASSPASDFIHPPVGANPDLFPLAVFNVWGKNEVTGSHTRYRPKSSSVTVRDQNG